MKPDDIPPDIQVPPDKPGAYDRVGFRVPAVIISPFARRDYVSSCTTTTSIRKLIDPVWNLPALTLRDANADNLDSLDLRGSPASASRRASRRRASPRCRRTASRVSLASSPRRP